MQARRGNTGDAEPVRWHTGPLGGELGSGSVEARPANPVSDAPLASLIDIASVRALLDDLSALVGIPTAVLDVEGNILQSAGWQKACTGFHRAAAGSCANCNESDLFLASHLREGEFVDYKCKNGLWDVVTPIFVGTQHLGNLYCGQFFYDDDVVDEDFFAAQAEHFGYDKAAYMDAIRSIPRFSRERVRRVMGLMVGFAVHLSHLSLVNMSLSESRSQMESLINALPDPVWLKDTEGMYLSCNHAFERLLGIPAARIVGKTDHAFFAAPLAELFRAKDRETILARGPCSNEEWIPDADTGRPILMETVTAPLNGVSGAPVGVIGIARNVTERKRVEAEIQRLNGELEQRVADRTAELVAANRELETFSFAASHDIKGPLQRISSFSSLLETRFRDRLEGDGLLFLNIIRQNSTRLTQLVDDLLSHAKVAQQTLDLEAIDLSAAVDGVIQEKAEEIRESQAHIRVTLSTAEVLANEHALNQVLCNLLGNAIKYSSRATAPQVEIGGEPAEDRFRLWVRDNGIGFDMAYHDKIFEIFRRLHTYGEYEGSGVGLALVKRAMERMGGRVWAESRPEQGATFYLEFRIPRKAAAQPGPGQ